MSVARVIPKRIRDQQDANMSPGSGTNGYAIVYNHTSGKFELGTFEAAGAAAAAVAAHVAASDPHTQYALESALGTMATATETNYLLADGSRTGATSSRQMFTNGITVGSIRPASDSTAALQLQNAAGTAVFTVDTTNGRLGIGATPTQKLTVVGSGNVQMWIGADTSFGYTIGRNTGTGLLDILGTQSDPFRGLNVAGSITCSGPFSPGSFTLNNSTPIQAKDTGGTARSLMVLDGANNLLFGKSAYGGSSYFYIGASGGSVNFVDNTQSVVLASLSNAGLFGIGVTATALLDIAASTTARASLRIRTGVAPTSPNAGDIYFNGTNFFGYNGSAWKQLDN